MSKDAAATRLLLVRAARHRFAFDGYKATTVRDIAADAGVNVALINRYFGSKEGLFRACLDRVVQDLGVEQPVERGLERALAGLVSHVVRAPTDDDSLQLMLLLRSSGDDGADAIRRETLRRYAERLATAVGGEVTEELLVRAEIALSVVLGMTMLRRSTAVEPLASADDDVVAGALDDALRALLAPSR
ncbi:TetR family transcriptional regulator [Curtobacterium sp. PhB142]|uniref:TetR/AcrR family transcriptional regulator n=1 Tax=Bacteria TaxID=2 RepID=UPI000F47A080|nr:MULTISPECIES: TetR/AcrR family transcriptional regulator [unclassified Curtobacterium]MBF4585554.1 TetR/AcrR family transcriptional regulator [Curtobacterium sp. VKM Ac-2887]ROQ07091.1 TetR family transcriptional regulator [Curtobacterium sp. PhB171]ROQ28017.1 TetR family transcriptional regulator [Curtobacterium sp. PhB170]ROS34947.1 TetR family transcriptional regulator [Curtobacterium sp. PhB131]ROS72686.1 TetR family transcriptional regulator [Curtobacterium sp. PhB141]